MGRFNYRAVTVRGEDAVGAGIEFGPGPGDSSLGATNAENAEPQVVRNRGDFVCLTVGDSLEQEFSITVDVERQTATELLSARILDFVRMEGSFAAAQTTNLTDDSWTFTLIVTQTQGGVTQTYTCSNVKANYTWTEAVDRNTFTISGTIYGGIVVS